MGEAACFLPGCDARGHEVQTLSSFSNTTDGDSHLGYWAGRYPGHTMRAWVSREDRQWGIR